MMVVKDSCPGSRVAVPQWVDWISRSPSDRYSAIVVSVEGNNYLSQLAGALALRGVKAETLRVTQMQEFTLSSGVSVTPTLVAIDRSGYTRMVGGILSDTTARALNQFLEDNASVR